jgi:hypothetical protein
MKIKIAVLVGAFCFLWMPLNADEIRLNNGDKLNGSVLGVDEQGVLLATASGEFIIPRDKVVSVLLAGQTPKPVQKSKPVKIQLSDSSPAPKLGAMGGDFLEE